MTLYSDKAIAGIDGKECLAVQPSKQKAEIQQEIATAPMSDIGIDLFVFKGKTYFVLVCRFSGYFFVPELKKQTTQEVVDLMNPIFRTFGYPMAIRSPIQTKIQRILQNMWD